ncbi:MAG: BMP family ABC transporter substrate-binding protein, partial [Jatrophihabitans sp.]
MAVAGCGSKSGGSSSSKSPSTGNSSGSSPAASGNALKACMVLDTGGVDDKSFNQSSWAGMQAANQANSKITISYVPSNSGNDYTPNLKAEVTKG